jgi:hypothetical protein
MDNSTYSNDGCLHGHDYRFTRDSNGVAVATCMACDHVATDTVWVQRTANELGV